MINIKDKLHTLHDFVKDQPWSYYSTTQVGNYQMSTNSRMNKYTVVYLYNGTLTTLVMALIVFAFKIMCWSPKNVTLFGNGIIGDVIS